MCKHIRLRVSILLLCAALLVGGSAVLKIVSGERKALETPSLPGHQNASASAENWADAFPASDQRPILSLAGLIDHSDEPFQVAFTPDQKSAIVGGAVLGWWSVRTGENYRLVEARPKGEHLGLRVSVLAMSRNGLVFASGHRRSMIFLWDLATGEQLRTFSVPLDKSSHDIVGLAFSPDDSVLAAAVENRIYLLDSRSGQVIRRIDTDDWISSLAWDPNANVLATGHCARIIEPANPALDDRVRTESRIQVWDVATGKRMLTRVGGKREIFALNFSPDGRILAAGDSHRTGHLTLWDVSTGRELADVAAHPEDESHKLNVSTEILPVLGGVRSIAFSPDSRLFVSGGGDGLVRIWEVASTKELSHFDGRKRIPLVVVGGRTVVWASESVWSVAFAPDGNTVASAHQRGSALLWDLRRAFVGEEPLPNTIPAPELEACWAQLASPNPLPAYRAIEQLRAASRDSLPFVRERCRPLLARDPALIGRWIADLDSDDFSTREKGSHELASVADQAESALRATLAGRPSKEVQRRIRDILSGLDATRTSPDRLRLLRVCRLLEQIGTPEARKVVESLAKTDARTWLSEEAKSTLRRMKPAE